MTETPKKKTAAKKATSTKAPKPTTKPEAKETVKQTSSFLPFDLPFDLPKFDLPKVDLPKVEVPTQVTEVAERGREFVTDSVKSARSAAGSVRKNVAETVVLVREAVGV